MLRVMTPKGMHCPVCKGTDITPTNWKRPLAGLRVRYFKCNRASCGVRFRSDERLIGLTKKPWNGKRADPSPGI